MGGTELCKWKPTGNEVRCLNSQLKKLENEPNQAKATHCQQQDKGHSMETLSDPVSFVLVSLFVSVRAGCNRAGPKAPGTLSFHCHLFRFLCRG